MAKQSIVKWLAHAKRWKAIQRNGAMPKISLMAKAESWRGAQPAAARSATLDAKAKMKSACNGVSMKENMKCNENIDISHPRRRNVRRLEKRREAAYMASTITEEKTHRKASTGLPSGPGWKLCGYHARESLSLLYTVSKLRKSVCRNRSMPQVGRRSSAEYLCSCYNRPEGWEKRRKREEEKWEERNCRKSASAAIQLKLYNERSWREKPMAEETQKNGSLLLVIWEGKLFSDIFSESMKEREENERET